ncbi:MAG: small multi-drug export protein, partial [Clostridia bacterium]|nr:small multi-drug export protein [Clostridia bacterium]
EAIENFFVNSVGKELGVFICSMIPVIELRGGIPLGAALGLPWWESYLLAVAGNMVPVPIILLFVRKFISWMSASKVRFFNKIASFLERKAEKNRGKIEKYAFWGICLFVAVPLPITGAWTGALVCATIGEKVWRALVSCFIGVCIAGVIMTLASYGVVAALNFLV